MRRAKMKKTIKPEVATILTLRDMVGNKDLMGDIEIINECNETLLTLSYTEDNVCSLDKTLADELLDRVVLNFGTRDGRTLFKIEGVEDAD